MERNPTVVSAVLSPRISPEQHRCERQCCENDPRRPIDAMRADPHAPGGGSVTVHLLRAEQRKSNGEPARTSQHQDGDSAVDEHEQGVTPSWGRRDRWHPDRDGVYQRRQAEPCREQNEDPARCEPVRWARPSCHEKLDTTIGRRAGRSASVQRTSAAGATKVSCESSELRDR